MLDFIKNLFTHDETASDGLNQNQREGLIELLLIAMYADNKLTLNEDAMIKKQIEGFNWDSGIYLDGYLEEATSRVRSVRSDKALRMEFFNQIGEKLGNGDIRKMGYELCLRLFLSDGEESVRETAFAEEIKAAFKL